MDNPVYADYTQKILAGSEQAFLDAGYDASSAYAASLFSLSIAHTTSVMSAAHSLEAVKKEFIRSADFDSAEPAVIIGLTMGQRIQEQGPYNIDLLTGIAIEKMFLQQLDPLTQAGPGGQTAGEREELLDAKLLELKDLSSRYLPIFMQSDEAMQARYLAKVKSDGELAAMRWLVNGK